MNVGLFGNQSFLIREPLMTMSIWQQIFWVTAAILAYHYFGYLITLLILQCLVRRQPRQTPSEQGLPTVTLAIPAYNEERVLGEKLENAISLDYPQDRLEILVLSDGSTDKTVEIARSFEGNGVRLAAFPDRRGKASILNEAANRSTADVLCMCDANVMFRRDALRILVNCLTDPQVGAATGQVRLESHQSNFGYGEALYYWFERILQAAESKVGCLMGVDGGMYVVRRSLYEPLRPDTILDDFTVSINVIRQRLRVVYDSKAVATENGTPTGSQEFHRRVRIAAGAGQSLKRGYWPPLSQPILIWQFISHKFLRWINPLLLPLFMASNAVLWDAGVIYPATLGVQALFYGLALAALAFVPFRRTPFGGIPYYFVLSHVAMALGLVKGLLNMQRVTWKTAERVVDLNGRADRTRYCDTPVSLRDG